MTDIVEQAKRDMRSIILYLHPDADSKHAARAISSANSVIDALAAEIERLRGTQQGAEDEIERLRRLSNKELYQRAYPNGLDGVNG